MFNEKQIQDLMKQWGLPEQRKQILAQARQVMKANGLTPDEERVITSKLLSKSLDDVILETGLTSDQINALHDSGKEKLKNIIN